MFLTFLIAVIFISLAMSPAVLPNFASTSPQAKCDIKTYRNGDTIGPIEKSRYVNVYDEDFNDAEKIDLSNTSAGVDTSRGIVFLGGTEHFPGKLIFTAMDNAHNGNMGGIAGADRLVNQNAAQQGFGSSRWKAMLSSSNQNMCDIIREPYASTMPIVDRNQNLMYNNWNDIFDGNSVWRGGQDLRSFCNREVDENTGANPDWQDADGWHGTDTRGRCCGETCNDWTGGGTGRAAELDCGICNPLHQESGHSWSQTLAVMVIELPGSMFSGDKNLGHIQSKVLHNEWPTIGAARMTWYENTPPGTQIIYNMTADDEHWATMENHTTHVFKHQGSQLRWNATLKTNNPSISPAIYRVVIEYDLISPPEPHCPDSEEWQGTTTPLLEWNFTDPDTGDHQSDYLVEIFDEEDMGTALYNSSWINSTTPEHTVPEELEDGTYFWRVRTKDVHHAPSNFSELKMFKIDVTKPVGNIIINEGALATNEQLIDLEISATDNGSGIADMQIVSDRGSAGPWEEYKTEKRIALTPTDGLKKIRIKFRDHAKIISDEFNDTIYFDLKGPGGIAVGSPTHPDPEWFYNSVQPVFRWEVPREVAGIKGYSYIVDAYRNTEPAKVIYNENSDLNSTFPGEFTGLKDGTWYFHITACDVYDQWSNTTHFKFNIDATDPLISEPEPDPKAWYNADTIQCSAVLSDPEGFGLDVESIKYSYKKEGGEYSPWGDENLEFEVLENGQNNNPLEVRAWVDVEIGEGDGNAVKWQVSDLAGNGPVESEALHIKVDRSPVTFRDPDPDEDEIFLETMVSCGITIMDGEGSGVDGKTVQYCLSHWGNDDELFTNWTPINNNMVKADLQVLTEIEFEAGKNNYIKWRAKDAVGNGFAESFPSRVWVNSAPNPVIQSPYDDESIEGRVVTLNASGTTDNEDDELSYYWVIKNRTSKKEVFSASGMSAVAELKDPGKYTVYLEVDDGNGLEGETTVNIEVWAKEGVDVPPVDDDDTEPENKTVTGGTKGNIVAKWWWLIAVVGVILIMFILVLIVIGRKKRDNDEEFAPISQGQYGYERPYPVGSRDFHSPQYSEMYMRDQANTMSPYGNNMGPGWQLRGAQPAISQMPDRLALPMNTGVSVQPQGPSRMSLPSAGVSPVGQQVQAQPQYQQPSIQLIGTSQAFPQYQLPTFALDEGIQNLNLLALPSAQGSAVPSEPLNVQQPVSQFAPAPVPAAASQAGSVELATTSIDSLLEGHIPAAPALAPLQQPPSVPSPFEMPATSVQAPPPQSAVEPSSPASPPAPKSMGDDVLEDIFGTTVSPPPPMPPVGSPPPEPPVPPSTENEGDLQVFQCHACGAMCPVATHERPTVVTCKSCGAQGYLEG